MNAPEASLIDRRTFLVSSAVAAAVASFAGESDAAPDDRFLDDLVTRMTLPEKAGQLHMEAALSPRVAEPDIARLNPFMPPTIEAEARARFDGLISRVEAGGVGALMTPMDLESVALAQQAAVRRSRLGIPLLICADIIHGCRTVFPVPLGEAASFEPELARRTARACAVEATANGLDVTFAPMVDIGRDQRWGRVVEGAGEDVLLGSLIAAARVAGFQGGRRDGRESLLACVKHFAAYGAAEGGLDYSGNALSERVLHEVYMPPFKAAFEAGALLVMAAFNTIDGVPSTGNHRLLTTILRDRFGFQGAVISDFESDEELVAHGFAKNEQDAAHLTLTAGCDMGMMSGIFPRFIPSLVESGMLGIEILDRAVRRILFVKREAGLFDDPFRRINPSRHRRPAPAAHLALAREAARKSAVLLKNEGDVLPLSKESQRIALIGPFGEDIDNLNGPWSPFAPEARSIPLSEGLRAAMKDPSLLAFVAASRIEESLPGGVEAAVEAARASDVVVLAIGESQEMSGEAASRTEIVIPRPQQELAEAIARTGKPIVVVLRNGRALELQGAVRDAQAILVGWFLGTATGPALADILFGDVSPSGRLPVSFPLRSGQQPYYYARESSGRPAGSGSLERFRRHYLGIPDAPLYAFGHGLSYSPIVYGPTTCSAAVLEPAATLSVSAQVSNRGERSAEEVVQLYVHGRAAEVVQPVRRLVAFSKVTLLPGDSRNVSFTLSVDQLTHLDRSLNVVPLRGVFDVWVAPSATAGEAAQFTVA